MCGNKHQCIRYTKASNKFKISWTNSFSVLIPVLILLLYRNNVSFWEASSSKVSVLCFVYITWAIWYIFRNGELLTEISFEAFDKIIIFCLKINLVFLYLVLIILSENYTYLVKYGDCKSRGSTIFLRLKEILKNIKLISLNILGICNYSCNFF